MNRLQQTMIEQAIELAALPGKQSGMSDPIPTRVPPAAKARLLELIDNAVASGSPSPPLTPEPDSVAGSGRSVGG